MNTKDYLITEDILQIFKYDTEVDRLCRAISLSMLFGDSYEHSEKLSKKIGLESLPALQETVEKE